MKKVTEEIMFANLNQLKNLYNIQTIETSYIQLFVEQNNIVVNDNILIKSILSESSSEIEKIKDALQTTPETLDLYKLVRLFELLIVEEDRKLNGAVFTPEIITKFLTEQTITSKEQKICDLSCGCGAFLPRCLMDMGR